MPNFIILAIVFIVGYAVLHSSANKDAQKTREQIAKMATLTEPAMVQGDVGIGAWLLAVVIVAVGVYAAMPR